MFGTFPARIVVGLGAVRLLEQELREYEFNNKFAREAAGEDAFKSLEDRKKKLTYMGVKVEFDDREKFVRLESKKC
jgi:hypothetical protein